LYAGNQRQNTVIWEIGLRTYQGPALAVLLFSNETGNLL
jgi:hypothetical protein